LSAKLSISFDLRAGRFGLVLAGRLHFLRQKPRTSAAASPHFASGFNRFSVCGSQIACAFVALDRNSSR
jgi:hypothetical protein